MTLGMNKSSDQLVNNFLYSLIVKMIWKLIKFWPSSNNLIGELRLMWARIFGSKTNEHRLAQDNITPLISGAFLGKSKFT